MIIDHVRHEASRVYFYENELRNTLLSPSSTFFFFVNGVIAHLVFKRFALNEYEYDAQQRRVLTKERFFKPCAISTHHANANSQLPQT